MAIEPRVSIQGKLQGSFRGNDIHGLSTKDSIEIGKFNFPVQAPHDASSGQPSGKHKPIVITKEWGASSPQLWQALVTNEVLQTVDIEIPGPDASTPIKIHLKNARVLQMPYVGAGKYMVSFGYEQGQSSDGAMGAPIVAGWNLHR